MKLTISGTTPSKKNGKRIVPNYKTGGSRIISSKNYMEWEESAVEELEWQFKGYLVTEYPISLSLVFYFGDKRRHDLDNACASVLDALVKAGVVEDDNVNFVECITLQYGGHDKLTPRVEIFIDE